MLTSACISCDNFNNDIKGHVLKTINQSPRTAKESIQNIQIDIRATDFRIKPSGNYSQSKQSIEQKRLKFHNRYHQITDSIERKLLIDSALQYFTSALLNDIIPYWYSTVWDFNGYTDIPLKGSIACGYFVSTTLKHAGLNINRFKLAQQNAYNEAKTLQADSLLKIINNDNHQSQKEICDTLNHMLKTGLYFIGLNCHVGYLYIKNDEIYFIHSDYISGSVKIEKAEYSKAFQSSVYSIADITHNKTLIKDWINGKEITVVTD